ncbi:MAG TPA: VWA domain-containing protein [Candidatus Binatia bacterium]|nr:VWA domain-containing protein [Candidatus Binatia bacterium]
MHLGPIEIGSPAGLLWLLLIIPLILFYLIRPKPKVKEIPSLMFFMNASGRNKLLSFLRTFVHDFLMLVQLLIILALALTPAQPASNVQHDISGSNTIIVIDASASMQTKEGSSTRLELAIDAAKDSLSTHNSVIIAEERPRIAIQDANDRDTVGVLNFIKPTDSGSRIGDAMVLAGELLREKEGRIVVVSDFITTGGVEPSVAKAVLQARGKVVTFINVGEGKKHNVGFIDLNVDDEATTAYVKNFNDEEATVTVKVADQEKQLTIAAKGVEPYVFKTLPNVAKLEITQEDDLPADNTAFTSAPEKVPVKILLITNTPSPFLQNALKAASNVELTVSQPPVIAKGDFDVVIIDNVNKDEVLAGTYDDILKDVQRDGKTAIVNAQENSLDIDYRGLVPFGLTGTGENGYINVENPTRFTRNIEFGKLPTYFTTNLQPGVVPVAIVGNNSAIITVATVPGGGKLIWYGIPEKNTDFKFSPYYPIFWYELIKYVTNQKDITGMNFRTGTTLLLDKDTKVVSPSGTSETNRIIFDKAGIYELPDRKLAVNLLNEQESDINPREKLGDSPDDVKLTPVRELRSIPWEITLLVAALVILFVELLYVKIRGDI